MQILGRTVGAVRYEGATLVNAYVNQKPGDCRRKSEPDYQCMANCENKLVIARFENKKPLSIKALVPVELSVDPGIPNLKEAHNLCDLELIAKEAGYELRDENKGKVLYYRGQKVAIYNPCGFDKNPELFSEEVGNTINELVTRVDEVYEIAKTVPLREVLNDLALKKHLNDPRMLQMATVLFGHEAAKLVVQLRKMQQEN